MKRKVVSIILVLALLTALLAGCSQPGESTNAQTTDAAADVTAEAETATEAVAAGGDESADGDSDSASGEPKFKIGSLRMPFNNLLTRLTTANFKYICEGFGGELVEEVIELTPEDAVNGCEKLINAGCDALTFWPVSMSMLPKVAEMCEESGTFFVIRYRNPELNAEPDVAELIYASPAYAGCVYENEVEGSYQFGKLISELGGKSIAIIGDPLSDPIASARTEGLKMACDDFDMEIVAEVRSLNQGSEATQAVQSMIAAYPELDTVVPQTASLDGVVDSIITGFKQAGKNQGEIFISSTDMLDGVQEGMEAGWVNVAFGGHLEEDAVLGLLVAINSAMMGHRMDDTYAEISLKMMEFTNVEDMDFYNMYVEGILPIYTLEELEPYIYDTNPDVTLADIQQLADDFTIPDIVSRHEGLTPEDVPTFYVEPS